MRTLFCILILLLGTPILAQSPDFGGTWEAAPDQLLLHRLTKLLNRHSSRFQRPPSEPIVAATCVRAPTSSDFYDTKAALTPVPGQKPLSPETLHRPSQNLKEVFHLLRQTQTGRAILAKFDPKFGFEVKVEQFHDSLRRTERRRAAALFDLETRTIYVDRKERVGNLAPIFLHEMVHSLDRDYLRAVDKEKELWNEFDTELENTLRAISKRKRKAVEQIDESDFSAKEIEDIIRMKLAMEQFRDVRIYRAERVAYDLYNEVLKELAAQYPEFYLRPGRKISSIKPFSDSDLVRVEGLSSSTISKYLKGSCRAFK